jgi:hypothetical protein
VGLPWGACTAGARALALEELLVDVGALVEDDVFFFEVFFAVVAVGVDGVCEVGMMLLGGT